MIVFGCICKGKLKIVACFARQEKFYSLFLWRKHVTISSFPLQMPAKSIVTRLKHVTNARRAARKCQISLLHKPGTVETVRFSRKCCWSRAGPMKKCHFHGRCIALTNERMPQFCCQTCLGLQAGPRADCLWAPLVNPEVKASDVFLFGLHPKITTDLSSEAYKLEVKSSHMLLRGLHPT